MKHVENVFFSPTWVQSLGLVQKEQLNKLAEDGLDVMGSPPSVPAQLNMDFQLPTTTRTFRVG